jgi:DNA-directed RNA polymerase subunit RPC12/RpoP
MKRDLADILLFNSVGAVRSDRECCSGCSRTPLAGETMQRLADDRLMCPLCFSRISAKKRSGATAERVHVGATRLAVVSRAAAA